MPNLNDIDYQNMITVQNTTAIESIIQLNIDLNQNISQIQTQIADNNAQIAQLQVYNTYITMIIGQLTDPAMIAYQNGIATNNTATIAQLTQLNVNLNQSTIQLQTIITNNIAMIRILQTGNTYIVKTIAVTTVPTNNTL